MTLAEGIPRYITEREKVLKTHLDKITDGVRESNPKIFELTQEDQWREFTREHKLPLELTADPNINLRMFQLTAILSTAETMPKLKHHVHSILFTLLHDKRANDLYCNQTGVNIFMINKALMGDQYSINFLKP